MLATYLTTHGDLLDVGSFQPLPASSCYQITITIYPSAVATFYAPCDISGTGGMRKEHIRAIPSWRGGLGRFDTVFVKDFPGAQTILSSLTIARVRFFFSFKFRGLEHRCALVTDYPYEGTAPDTDTGMWIVCRPAEPKSRVIPITQIFRAAHLIPVYHSSTLPKDLDPLMTIDTYSKFYVNRYIDHCSFEIA